MHYDVVSKLIISRCKETFLKYFCGLSVKDAIIIETRPQETASLRRSDFVIKTVLQDNTEFLVLIEFVSFWKSYLPLRTLECRCRHILEENLPVKTFIFLLTPSSKAMKFYQDEEVRYEYNLVKLYEMDARKVLEEGMICLYPFVPVMREGEKGVFEAERKIYESELPREEKADYLTGLTIFAGLKSRELVLELIKRRRDIMIESVAYEIIKKEGYEEGLKAGIQQGIQQGLLEEAREMVIEALEEKFGVISAKLIARIRAISEREILRSLLRTAIKVQSLEEFKKVLEKVERED